MIKNSKLSSKKVNARGDGFIEGLKLPITIFHAWCNLIYQNLLKIQGQHLLP